MNLDTDLFRKAVSIVQKLHDAGHYALFAGGCVRDYLMSEAPHDFDIASTAKPEEVEALFDKTIPVGKQFGVILVVIGDDQFEVATFRGESEYQDGRHPEKIWFTNAEEDALRRDFTVNGLFYDPLKQEVIDYVGGQKDLGNKIIRSIGVAEDRFTEDKLRLLRAVRFASTLGFGIEDLTWKATQKMASQINVVSPERIRDELVKIMTRPGAAHGFQLLSDSGLMQVILPEIEAMKGCEQQPEYHPEGDVFVHTKLLLEKLDKPSVTLAFGALFHDVAKPPTYEIRKGKITFYAHAPIGADMTKEIMKRLRFSNQEIKDVCEAVRYHMTFGDAQNMRSGKLKRFVMRPTFEDEMELHRIDCLSSHGMLDNYTFLQDKLKEYEVEDLKPEAFLSGHDVLKTGCPKGPKIRQLLEEAYDLQLEGQLKTREEALEWLNSQVNSDT